MKTGGKLTSAVTAISEWSTQGPKTELLFSLGYFHSILNHYWFWKKCIYKLVHIPLFLAVQNKLRKSLDKTILVIFLTILSIYQRNWTAKLYAFFIPTYYLITHKEQFQSNKKGKIASGNWHKTYCNRFNWRGEWGGEPGSSWTTISHKTQNFLGRTILFSQ